MCPRPLMMWTLYLSLRGLRNPSSVPLQTILRLGPSCKAQDDPSAQAWHRSAGADSTFQRSTVRYCFRIRTALSCLFLWAVTICFRM